MTDGDIRFHPVSGEIITVRPDDPAAGVDLVYILPDDFEYWFQSMRFNFAVTGGGVTRQPFFCYADQTGTIFEELSDVTVGVGANITFNYQFTTAVTDDHLIGTNVHASAPQIILPGGYSIVFSWTNKQAADQLSGVIVNYIRWRIK